MSGMYTKEYLLSNMWEDQGTGSGYWAEYLEFNDNDTVTWHWQDEYTGTTESRTFTRFDFESAAYLWAVKSEHVEYLFFRDFAQDYLAGNWDIIDYDGEVIDQIVQSAIFGNVIYG